MRRFIGIDLGTTNTALYWLDADAENAKPEIFEVLQTVERGEASGRKLLPSFLYLPDAKDLPEGALALPWNAATDIAVGEYARKRAPEVPGKVISSTKSWLCAQNVDRNARLLPWNRNNPERQLSPVEASAKILAHLRDAWNAKFKEEPLETQEIVLTVPASFDAVARELTVKAAEMAGLKITLLEEPLAAFHCWLQESGDTWRESLKPGQTALVIDIGGGTSDFTLVKAADSQGNLEFERLAVGRHILLGGDNMDLTLAYAMAAKLKGETGAALDPYQIAGLTHACRQAKETLLSGDGVKPQKLTVLGRGSGVVAKTLSCTLSREELDAILLEGFLPKCGLDAKAETAPKAGLRSFGLVYEANPAITIHLAEFLSKHCKSAAELPSALLFNGGVTKGLRIKERLAEIVGSWRPKELEPLKIMSGNDPDLAVAKGACFYAAVKHGKGIRIKAGSARSYYVGVEASLPAVPGFKPPMQALCVAPFGMEEGTGSDIAYSGLGLLVGETTEFRFFASTSRKTDRPGEILDSCDGLETLPPLTMKLEATESAPAGTLTPVTLRAELTETGTLQVLCVGQDGTKWKLEFELRAAA